MRLIIRSALTVLYSNVLLARMGERVQFFIFPKHRLQLPYCSSHWKPIGQHRRIQFNLYFSIYPIFPRFISRYSYFCPTTKTFLHCSSCYKLKIAWQQPLVQSRTSYFSHETAEYRSEIKWPWKTWLHNRISEKVHRLNPQHINRLSF